jgi:hypothetical protein
VWTRYNGQGMILELGSEEHLWGVIMRAKTLFNLVNLEPTCRHVAEVTMASEYLLLGALTRNHLLPVIATSSILGGQVAHNSKHFRRVQ